MVSLVNGNLSTDGAKKGLVENGYPAQVKYKARKVSAVRDFPPGCGPNVSRVSLNSLEMTEVMVVANNVEDNVEADDAKTENVEHESVSQDVANSKVLTELVAGSVEKPLSPHQGRTSDVDISAETSLRNKYTLRRVSAIRDFPPFCGRKAPLPTEEDRVRINSGKKCSNVVEEDCVRNAPPPIKADCVGINIGKKYLSVVEEDCVRSAPPPAVQCLKASPDAPLRHGKESSSTSKEIVVYTCEESHNGNMLGNAVDLKVDFDREIVQGLMATTCHKFAKQKGTLTILDNGISRKKEKKHDFTGQEKSRLGGKTKTTNKFFSSRDKSLSVNKVGYKDTSNLVIKDAEDCVSPTEGKLEISAAGQGSEKFEVTLPPLGPNSSNCGDARNRVRECLRLFQAICRKVLQGVESKSRHGEQPKSKQKDVRRIDLLAAKILKDKGKEVHTEKQILGAVPGVEVGDEFQYRVELAIVGIHRLYQAGIDYMKHRGEIVAASIVASGGYADELDSADVLIYSGQGGNVIGKDKQPEDQKLERGNLALKNSISAKNAVRVIRGSKETKASDSVDARSKVVMKYVYDGLYTVDRYWQEEGTHGKLVFKFELRRILGQPELALIEVKKSVKSKTREGLCVSDISGGKEIIRICAVNTIDDGKPPPFTYIPRMIYPDHCLTPYQGCDCKGGCLDARTCLCVAKNGEIPYNFNGAIVEAKPLVYECGPSCKCPPSCYNRVSQHGIKYQLEIFKTESRGWGVRSLNSISSGSFICEYIGELLEDREAEKRIDDEYLFHIDQNYNDCSQAEASSSAIMDGGGFTIYAAEYGNVGRFINHSCSPNLYAQNVLYDHDNKNMPHIMFFAAENIPPLQELTYHYNYAVNQFHDSNGKIKVKKCYCGSAECSGRLY